MAKITLQVPDGNTCKGCKHLDNFSEYLSAQGKRFCTVFDIIVYNEDKPPMCKQAGEEGGFW